MSHIDKRKKTTLMLGVQHQTGDFSVKNDFGDLFESARQETGALIKNADFSSQVIEMRDTEYKNFFSKITERRA